MFYLFGSGELARVAEYYFRHVKQDSRSWLPNFSPNSLGESIVRTVDRDYITDDEMDFDLVKSGQIFIPIGYKNLNTTRERVFNEARARGLTTLDHISSEARIHKDVVLAPNSGNWIQESVAIQTGCKIGKSNILWGGTGLHLGHLTEIGDFNWISTGTVIAGGCKIGNNCFFGVNTSIRNNIEIASFNIICMGAIVTKSTKPYQVWLPGLNNPSSVDAKDFKIDK